MKAEHIMYHLSLQKPRRCAFYDTLFTFFSIFIKFS